MFIFDERFRAEEEMKIRFIYFYPAIFQMLSGTF